MRYELKIIPGAKRDLVRQEKDIWKVYLVAPAVDGKANKALVSLLADYFQVRKNQIQIIKGLKSRYKTISIKAFR
jgi:uncharacterized protein (TIGR00251 family)